MTTVRQNARRTDHVVFYPMPPAQVCCTVCGKTRKLPVPLPAKRAAILLANFARRHADCTPNAPPKERIHKHLSYITRQEHGKPKRTVLLSHGGFKNILDAETMIWIELEPGVKEYVSGMEDCRTHKGSLILANPGRFEIEGGE